MNNNVGDVSFTDLVPAPAPFKTKHSGAGILFAK